MPSISINGKTRTITGAMIIGVVQGRITVNGEDVTPGEVAPITIHITGDVASLDVDVCQAVTVGGQVGELRTSSGEVRVAQGAQSIRTSSGAVTCGDVAGDVASSSGNVTCGQVAGGVRTSSGDIHHR